MSQYPAALDLLSTSHQDNVGEVIHAQTDNDQSAAINAIELELGLNPAGASVDVVTRLNANDTELGTNPSGVYVDVATRLTTLETLDLSNSPSGSTYTLVLNDASKCVTMLNGTSSTITIPLNASVAFLTGTEIRIRQGSSAGAVTIAAAGGVTLINPFSSFVLAGPGAEAKLLKIGTNTWSLNGEVV